MSTQEVDINKWHEICNNGFNGDKIANDFILFLESCSKKQQDDSITWTTANHDFQAHFNELNISNNENGLFSIQNSVWLQLVETKRQARMEWHQERQMQLKHHLKTTLNASSAGVVVSEQYQRLESINNYVKTMDLGSVPILRGLVGFLRFQLLHKGKLAEWHMGEYVLTQKDEDAMDRDIQVLQKVLGFQLIYKDDTDNDDTVIPMDGQGQEEEELIWCMNPELSDQDIHEILKTLPKDQNTQSYQLSNIERKHQTGLFQWLYQLVLNCFSFLSL